MSARRQRARPARSNRQPASRLHPQHSVVRRLALPITLALVTLVVYWPAIHGSLVWDDDNYLTKPELRSLAGLGRIWFDLGTTAQYYPLLYSAFWAQARLWGDHVTGYHLVGIGLHIYCSLMLVPLVRRLGLPGAWFAAFLFALHPVHAESVAWITEQKNTLSTAFYLTSAYVYLQFDRTRRTPEYVLASVLFVLAILSKTVTATLPFAILVVLWWQRGRLEWRRDVLPLAGWMPVGIGAGVLTSWMERVYVGADGTAFTLSYLERTLLAGRVVWFYVRSLVWPNNLMFNYPRWTIDASAWWQYLFPIAVVAVVSAAWLVRRRTRALLAASLLFIGSLVPVLGFLNVYPFIYSYVADHFQYVASLAIIVPLAAASMRLVTSQALSAAAVRAGATALLMCLGLITRGQSAMFKDAETLYAETVARNPESWLAQENLGIVLIGQPDRLPDAIRAFEKNIRIRPDRANAHRNLATALAAAGQHARAASEYQAALRIEPDYAEDHIRLARVLFQIPGRTDEAMRHLETGLRLDPDSPGAHLMMGRARSNAGDPDGAEREFRATIRVAPDLPAGHFWLGTVLARQPNRVDEAIREYERAIALSAEYAEAHEALGALLLGRPGRRDDGLAHLRTGIDLRPADGAARARFGIALSAIPERRAEAIVQLDAALRLDPTLANARQRLAALQSSVESNGAASSAGAR